MNCSRARIVIVSSLLLCWMPVAARADKVDAFIRGRMASDHVPGVSVAVVRNGKVVLARGYGLANVELAVPATPDTVYQLASVTKQFTATAVMMLVEAGKIGLDDKITKYLDGLPTAWGDVRIRQLLSHTSGIKSYTSVPDFFKTARKDYAKEEILKLVADAPLDFPPGERWSYSNTGYFLLGMLIEKVTGKAYGAFLHERIFFTLAEDGKIDSLNVRPE
jgi:D-alanyl-D-alanine carboxypeptidase